MSIKENIVFSRALPHCVCPSPSQGKLVKYFSRQLSCKCKVALEERSAELEDFPRLGHWFRIVNLRKEVTQVRHKRCPDPVFKEISPNYNVWLLNVCLNEKCGI